MTMITKETREGTEICPFTAVDAKQIADQKQKEIKESYLQQIYENIYNAALTGKYKIEITDADILYDIIKECKNELKAKGFEVSDNNRNYIRLMCIYWDKPETEKK